MGIKNLYTEYFFSDSEDCQLDKLHNTFLIIDGLNVSIYLWDEVSCESEKLGGNYDLFGWHVKRFFMTLECCNITPFIVLDGVQNYLADWANNANRSGRDFGDMQHHSPLLVPYVFYNITRSMGIRSLRTMGEADNAIAALARAYDCPVLSQDNDFFFYGVKFIPYHTLSHQSIRCAGYRSLPCRIYRPKELLEKFHGIESSLLPLALELLQHKNGISEVFKSFFSSIVSHERIRDTLIWLSKFKSLNQAVAEVLKHIDYDKKQMVLGQFEKSISEFATLSADILPFLELDDEKVDYLEKSIEQQRVQFLGHTGSDDFEITEKMLIKKAPEWWCRDFLLTGIPKGTVMKLVIHYLRVSEFGEEKTFHPTDEADTPVITKISELLISSMENKEYVLNVPIKDRNNEIRSIRLKKWHVNLKALRKFGVTERIQVINEIFGIENGGIIQGLPEGWRLYVTTILYWMKQKGRNEKTKVHLYSLLFTMLLGIVDEKIGFYRRIYNDRAFVAGKYRDWNESEAYSDLNVSKEEGFAAAKFFRTRSTMTDNQFKKAVETVCKNFQEIFWEFQSCLRFALQLNALLDCPYVPSPIQELYNGTLLYNVFTKFSEAENIDECVEEILKESPGLISVFKSLKDIVLQELNESAPKK